MTALDRDLLAILRCPVCRGELAEEMDPHRLRCVGCGRRYAVNDGIPALAPDLAEEE
jgi:uncharacterized protein YbaR (Trm112 family)